MIFQEKEMPGAPWIDEDELEADLASYVSDLKAAERSPAEPKTSVPIVAEDQNRRAVDLMKKQLDSIVKTMLENNDMIERMEADIRTYQDENKILAVQCEAAQLFIKTMKGTVFATDEPVNLGEEAI